MTRLNPDGLLLYRPGHPMKLRLSREEARRIAGFTGRFPAKPPGPEVAHLEISNRCDLTCIGCPTAGSRSRPELSTESWEGIIRQLAETQVLEVSFGGGDPFLREDVFHLAAFARKHQLSVTATTRPATLECLDLASLGAFDQINLSLNSADSGRPIELPEPQILRDLLSHTLCGFNLVVTGKSYASILAAAERASAHGAELYLLALKLDLPAEELAAADREAARAMMAIRRTRVTVRIDCLLANRCAAANRICAIDCSGDVLPCSFLRETLGKLPDRSFQQIWSKGYHQTPRCESNCPFSRRKLAHAN